MTDTKIAPWIETFTGKQFYFLDPKEEDVDITDIAHSLSMQCRYTGHSRNFYSVAEHSVAVADYLNHTYNDKKLALAGLLHDASEAYLSDIASPVKQFLTGYSDMEERIQDIIAKKYEVDFSDLRIKQADITMLSTEIWDLLPSRGRDWNWDYYGGRPDKVEPVVGLPPKESFRLFMGWFEMLTNKPKILVANG